MIASAPAHDIPPPPDTVAFIDSRRTRAVWVNELGGVTWEVGEGARRSFLKWAPADTGLSFDAEVSRLAWAAPLWPVPRLLDRGREGNGEWIATTAVPGRSAVDPRWLADPHTAARLVGEALRAMHDALPVADCPFTWSVEDRLACAVRESIDPAATEAASAALGPAPPLDRLVVCHGDACVPNTLLADDGRWTGHVDLGGLGVADRWADLAVATWSTEWNYGPGYESALLAGYGIAPDELRTSYYRGLWDLR